MDDEAVARRVEADVIDIASNVPVASSSKTSASVPSTARADVPAGGEPVVSTPVAAHPVVESEKVAPVSDSAPDPWGGLPAPWEPLPDWVLALPEVQRTMIEPEVQDSGLTTPAAAPETTHVAPARAVSVERAEEGRVLDHVAAAPHQAKDESQKSAAPDLDVLARHVYSVLKRRLEAEHRRQLL
jgi:hypothetical protein